MKYYYAFILILFSNCGSDSINTEQNIVPEKEDSVSQYNSYKKPTFLREPNKLNVTPDNILDIISRVYNIDKKDKFFQIKTCDIKEIKYRHNVTSFDTSGAVRLYRYGNFGILEYINKQYSNFAFNKIFDTLSEPYKDIWNAKTDEGIAFEYDLIEKSGIVYILKENCIIYKLRRCNDDWEKNELLEEKFITEIFESPPVKNYLIRFCCSCPIGKNMELK